MATMDSAYRFAGIVGMADLKLALPLNGVAAARACSPAPNTRSGPARDR